MLSTIPAPMWIDIACATLIIALATWDAIRGLSATLAQIAALVLAFKLSFLLYPHIASLLPSSGAAAPALVFGLTLVAAFVIFIILRLIIAKVAHLILISPIDNILGAIAGIIKGLLLLFVIFCAVALVTRSYYSDTAFAKSHTGIRVMPVVERIIAPDGVKLPCATGGR